MYIRRRKKFRICEYIGHLPSSAFSSWRLEVAVVVAALVAAVVVVLMVVVVEERLAVVVISLGTILCLQRVRFSC